MAQLGTITKQPAEKLPYDIDYSTVLGSRSGTVGTPTTAITPSGAGSPSISDTTLTGTAFQFYLNGGTDGNSYSLTITTSITVGGKIETVQDEISIVVQEVA